MRRAQAVGHEKPDRSDYRGALSRRGYLAGCARAPLALEPRERHDEGVARAAGVAAVTARDAPDDGEAEAAVEGLEQLLALGCRYPGSGVGHLEADFAARFCEPHPNGRRAVPARVLEQVADHPAQQPRIAGDADRLTFELGVLVARAFLGGDGEDIHVLGSFRLGEVEAAGEENFVDQAIELGDVLLEAAL